MSEVLSLRLTSYVVFCVREKIVVMISEDVVELIYASVCGCVSGRVGR